ncbi:MAG: methyltransferase [Terriglobales bacterium]
MPSPAVATPAEKMMQILSSFWINRALFVTTELGIPDLLADGPKHCTGLAASTKAHPSALYRVLRALAMAGVYVETGPRQFGLTPLSELLRCDVPGSMRPLVLFQGDAMQWDSYREMRFSIETSRPATEKALGSTIFEYMRENPAAGTLFNQAMTTRTSMEAGAVVEAYDFGGVGTLVDVAGGLGGLLATILAANPSMRGVLFDLPQVIADSRLHGEIKGAMLPRVDFAAGNFFETVPGGGDAYLLKHIVHDWYDDKAGLILQNCRKVMGPQSRLLLVETVIPEGPEPHFGKLLDLQMLIIAGGMERTEAEFRTLLAGAGFRLQRVVPTKSPVSVVEAVPA